ncbi:TRAP transporter fused permease subunit [Candidatus Poribacteria bacterium]|nr:TRAP transporter fused permease subunit [Candidatus Poribacteria bacterium]
MEKGLKYTIGGLSVTLAIYSLAYSQTWFLSSIRHQNLILLFGLVLVFLTTMQKNRKFFWPCLLLIIASFFAAIYVHLFEQDLWDRQGFPNTLDIVVGIIIIVAVIEAMREAFGYILFSMVLLSIAYLIWGHNLPGVFYHPPMKLVKVVSYLSIGFHGIYGTFLSATALYIVLFILFGGILQAAGTNTFFFEMGKMIGRQLRSGIAQTAVISSMLVGMFTGTAMGNVALTGSFTIPLMKRFGYAPEEAGAVEASASSGGQIMPPVLGAAAFLMVAITGIPYVTICFRILIIAILYYLGVGIGLQLLACKKGIPKQEIAYDLGIIIKRAPLFVIPVGIIIALLVMGYSPQYAGFWAIIATIAVSFTSKATALTFRRFVDGCKDGAKSAMGIIATCGGLGVIYTVLTVTGLGVKIGQMVEVWSMGSLTVATFITMGLSILIGCGAPTLAAYALVAIIVAPFLVKLGMDLLTAHLFCFVFATFSAVTPPVAPAAIVGSGMAGGNYFKTAFIAMKLCAMAYVSAWLMTLNSALTGVFNDLLNGIITLISACFITVLLQVVNFSYLFRKINPLLRGVFVAATLSLIAYIATLTMWFFCIGVILCILGILWQKYSET